MFRDAASRPATQWPTTSRDVADRLAMANSWADEEASSPSALRTRVMSRVATSRTWSLLAALRLIRS